MDQPDRVGKLLDARDGIDDGEMEIRWAGGNFDDAQLAAGRVERHQVRERPTDINPHAQLASIRFVRARRIHRRPRIASLFTRTERHRIAPAEPFSFPRDDVAELSRRLTSLQFTPPAGGCGAAAFDVATFRAGRGDRRTPLTWLPRIR